MELALMCDLRVAGERAKFGELFVLRGLCCGRRGPLAAASLVGREKAAELLYTGDVIDAHEALRIGLVRACRARRPARSAGRARERSPPIRRWRCADSRPGYASRSTRFSGARELGLPLAHRACSHRGTPPRV
jgi:enoyl-CoA hydratase/carnithine racemase